MTFSYTDLHELSVSNIEAMDFSTLVGYTNEPNMPSGGGATVRHILNALPGTPPQNVLEVGSNTGYACIEFASWLKGNVVGIDVNPNSVEFATQKAKNAGIGNVEFKVADGEALPFADNSFDLVFCSNVTSFIHDRASARNEYYRVLAPRGVLACAPIWYVEEPPQDLRQAVEAAVGTTLPKAGRTYWSELFEHEDATLVSDDDFEYVRQTDAALEDYAQMVINQSEHLSGVSAEIVDAMRSKLEYFYKIFDENLSYARFSVLLYRLNHPNPEVILHQTRASR